MNVVRLIRRVVFSAGHRYWNPDLSPEANGELFGRWASPYNHGHNYVMYAECTGVVDSRTGMVVNIKEIDDVLDAAIVTRLDGRSLNDEIPPFDRTPPSLENLLLYLVGRLDGLPDVVRLTRLRLDETEVLYAEWTAPTDKENALMTLTRIYEFAAAHRLHDPALSQAENEALFGKCNNPNGHGHNYVLEVTVVGEPDPRTGMIADIGEIDAAVNAEVVDRYDHKHLNIDVPELVGKMTTTEIVAQEIFHRLEGRLPAKLHRVRVLETPRSVFEVVA